MLLGSEAHTGSQLSQFSDLYANHLVMLNRFVMGGFLTLVFENALLSGNFII